MQGKGGREGGQRQTEAEASVSGLLGVPVPPAGLQGGAFPRAGGAGGRREGAVFRTSPCTQSIHLPPDIANLHVSLLV